MRRRYFFLSPVLVEFGSSVCSFDFSVIMLYRDDFFSRLILILSTFVLSGFRYFDNSVGVVFESRNFVKQELSVPSKVRFKYFLGTFFLLP